MSFVFADFVSDTVEQFSEFPVIFFRARDAHRKADQYSPERFRG